MATTDRVKHASVEGAAELFTPKFLEYLVHLHDRFTPRIYELRAERAKVLERTLKQGKLPTFLPKSKATTTDWKVAPVPEDLKRPGIEISGPASITSMFINALNPGPEGTRAEGDLDDDEDSAGHRLVDTLRTAHNRLKAVQRTLTYYDAERGREYKILEGEIPFFMHRERGLHLDEPDVTVEGKPIPASILGTALTLFYVGTAQTERHQGIYFYLPKLESAKEAAFWKEFFTASQDYLPSLKNAVIKTIPLVESLPLFYQMEEALYALGPYGAGLNAARWDMQASILEFIMADPNSVWPDRFGVDIKTTDFLTAMFRRLVAVCLKHDAVPIGGMATALPHRDEEVNKAAATAIRTDKLWEAHHGFIRAWVAHIYHMKTAADPFKELLATGWKPTPDMAVPENFPFQLKVPQGPVTVEGTRRNVRTLIEYVDGWLNGRGAKSIDSLAGRPGIHPALMEDLATARISVAQTAQRLLHRAKDSNTGQAHDFTLVKQLLHQEDEDILRQLKAQVKPGDAKAQAAYTQAEARYKKAVKICMRWIKNYTEFNFRSLGSYTRTQLDAIAVDSDAF